MTSTRKTRHLPAANLLGPELDAMRADADYYRNLPAERRRPGRPATGQTPTRSMRLGSVYDQAKAKAESEGTTITAVVEALLSVYVNGLTP